MICADPFPADGFLLSFDPALNSPGAALFLDGVLRWADRIKIPRSCSSLPLGERADAIVDFLTTAMPPEKYVPRMVVEFPQMYRGQKNKADPNDLLALALVAGAAIGRLGGNAVAIKTPTPAQWAGNVPKATTGDPWSSARGVRVASRLSAPERDLVPASHDAIDAVGLGLWSLGRFAPARGFRR